jgi:hypothetical protein
MTGTNQEPQWLSEIRKRMDDIIEQVGRSGLSLKEAEIANLLAYVDRLREALAFCASEKADHLYFTTLPITPRTQGQVCAQQALAWNLEGE